MTHFSVVKYNYLTCLFTAQMRQQNYREHQWRFKDQIQNTNGHVIKLESELSTEIVEPLKGKRHGCYTSHLPYRANCPKWESSEELYLELFAKI